VKHLGRLDETLNEDEDALCASGAQFRLRDMLIDEISYVDRAANKRRFLLVKRAPGSGEAMGDAQQVDGDTATSAPQKLDDQTQNPILSLTSETKNSLATGLTSALGHMVEVATAVKAAEETTEQGQLCLPVALGKQLRSAVGTVIRLLSSHVFKQDNKQVIEALAQVADTCMMLAEQVSEEDVDLSEVAARVKQMSELLTAVADRCDDTQAPDEPQPDTVQQSSEGSDDTTTTDEGTQKSEESDVAKLTSVVALLVEQLKQCVVPVVAPTTTKSETDVQDSAAQLENEVTQRLAELEKANAVLKAKLEKAFEEPPQRASGSTPTQKAAAQNGGGRIIFPLMYNNSVHDPLQGE